MMDEATKCDRKFCGHHVVRPGKTQCWCDSLNGPHHGDGYDEQGWVGYVVAKLNRLEELLDERAHLDERPVEQVEAEIAVLLHSGGAHDYWAES